MKTTKTATATKTEVKTEAPDNSAKTSNLASAGVPGIATEKFTSTGRPKPEYFYIAVSDNIWVCHDGDKPKTADNFYICSTSKKDEHQWAMKDGFMTQEVREHAYKVLTNPKHETVECSDDFDSLQGKLLLKSI